MADAIEFAQPLLSQKMSITEEDIIEISKVVKDEILADINKLIHARTEPLVQKISKLETENKQLEKDIDALEQYGRHSLVRISGLSERATGDETTTAVRKIMSEIDPDQNQKTSSEVILHC
jgi:alanyl-tRNA synthetase